MHTQLKNIYWLAGLLEGEGSFQYFDYQYPLIQLIMTDFDIINKAHKILGCTSVIVTSPAKDIRKESYKIYIGGNKAIGWMFTLYSLMGQRRQEKIKEIIIQWKNYKTLTNKKNHKRYIRYEAGKKICVLHGPVDGANAIYYRKYSACKGCYHPKK